MGELVGLRIEPEWDEAAVRQFREAMAALGTEGWKHQPIILPMTGTRVMRLNRWQRVRYRAAKWIMP